MKKILLILILSIIASSLPATAGVTVEESKVLDRWSINFGAFVSGLNTEIRVDNPLGGEGTTINLEDDLGFSSSETLPRFTLGYIVGQRHQVTLGYFNTNRESNATLTEEIEWEDLVFPVNFTVTAFYETTFLTLGYTYWFYSSEKTALGVSGNFVLFDLSSGIRATLGLGGPGVGREGEVKTSAPVAQVGFSVKHALPARFVVNGALAYITFNDVAGYSGDISSLWGSFEHRTWKNFGFGLGYNYNNYDIETDAIDFLGTFQYEFSGFEIYLRAAF